jgi:hypothetical protein
MLSTAEYAFVQAVKERWGLWTYTLVIQLIRKELQPKNFSAQLIPGEERIIRTLAEHMGVELP